MFVFTAKLNKKKAVIAMVALALLLILTIILVNSGGKSGSKSYISESGIKTTDDVVSYLASLGWQVDPVPIETQEIVIPRQFNGVYREYVELQKAQGYTIADYGGMKATRHSFRVTNYPSGESDIVADVVVYGQQIIAGDIQSTAIDGFMRGLK